MSSSLEFLPICDGEIPHNNTLSPLNKNTILPFFCRNIQPKKILFHRENREELLLKRIEVLEETIEIMKKDILFLKRCIERDNLEEGVQQSFVYISSGDERE